MSSLRNISWFKSWKQIICLITVIGAVQFIVLSFLAMVFYPGGYDFVGDYFSHLGQTEVMGVPNTISYGLWVTGTVVAGASLFPFWILIRTLFTGKTITNIIATLGSISGLLTSPLLICIGIFAMNIDPVEHGFVVFYFFLLFAIAIAFYSVAILLNEDYENYYGLVGVAFSVIIVFFVFDFFIAIDILMQKFIVYGFVLWAIFQVTKVRKAVN